VSCKDSRRMYPRGSCRRPSVGANRSDAAEVAVAGSRRCSQSILARCPQSCHREHPRSRFVLMRTWCGKRWKGSGQVQRGRSSSRTFSLPQQSRGRRGAWKSHQAHKPHGRRSRTSRARSFHRRRSAHGPGKARRRSTPNCHWRNDSTPRVEVLL